MIQLVTEEVVWIFMITAAIETIKAWRAYVIIAWGILMLNHFDGFFSQPATSTAVQIGRAYVHDDRK